MFEFTLVSPKVDATSSPVDITTDQINHDTLSTPLHMATTVKDSKSISITYNNQVLTPSQLDRMQAFVDSTPLQMTRLRDTMITFATCIDRDTLCGTDALRHQLQLGNISAHFLRKHRERLIPMYEAYCELTIISPNMSLQSILYKSKLRANRSLPTGNNSLISAYSKRPTTIVKVPVSAPPQFTIAYNNTSRELSESNIKSHTIEQQNPVKSVNMCSTHTNINTDKMDTSPVTIEQQIEAIHKFQSSLANVHRMVNCACCTIYIFNNVKLFPTDSMLHGRTKKRFIPDVYEYILREFADVTVRIKKNDMGERYAVNYYTYNNLCTTGVRLPVQWDPIDVPEQLYLCAACMNVFSSRYKWIAEHCRADSTWNIGQPITSVHTDWPSESNTIQKEQTRHVKAVDNAQFCSRIGELYLLLYTDPHLPLTPVTMTIIHRVPTDAATYCQLSADTGLLILREVDEILVHKHQTDDHSKKAGIRQWLSSRKIPCYNATKSELQYNKLTQAVGWRSPNASLLRARIVVDVLESVGRMIDAATLEKAIVKYDMKQQALHTKSASQLMKRLVSPRGTNQAFVPKKVKTPKSVHTTNTKQRNNQHAGTTITIAASNTTYPEHVVTSVLCNNNTSVTYQPHDSVFQ